ncbi:MAG: hypothetical protein ACXWPM_04470 [Bdellovibrionota bacterium]
MKTTNFWMGMMAMAAMANTAIADDMIQVGASADVDVQQTNQGADAAAIGRIWLSHEGQIRIVWDGVTLNLGKLGMRMSSAEPTVTAKFPTMTLDLQKLAGAQWMKSLGIVIAAGSYDNDPRRGTTDLEIGRISVNLSQTLHSDDRWSWTIGESVSGAAMFQRTFQRTGNVYQAVPVTLAVNTEIVRHLSQELSVTLAMGAYQTILESFQGGDPLSVTGGSLSASVALNGVFSTGVAFSGSRSAAVGSLDAGKRSVDATAFLKFIVSQGRGVDHPEQAISLNFRAYYNECLTEADGSVYQGLDTTVSYTVTF